MAATPLTIEAADELVQTILEQHSELIAVEDCEEHDDSIVYAFESGHWLEVTAGDKGLTHQLHEPDEE